jgi:hypothetical protein
LATTMRSFRPFWRHLIPSNHVDEFALIPSPFHRKMGLFPASKYKGFRESLMELPGASLACRSLNTGLTAKRPHPQRQRSSPQSLFRADTHRSESVQTNPHMQVLSKGIRMNREPRWWGDPHTRPRACVTIDNNAVDGDRQSSENRAGSCLGSLPSHNRDPALRTVQRRVVALRLIRGPLKHKIRSALQS